MLEAQQPPEEQGTTTTSISNTGTDTNTGAATSASTTTTTSTSSSSPYRSQRPGGEQSYRLKTVRYHNNDRKILLQNENGPCPLLAAANALLLRGAISLPPACIRNGIASLNDLVNVLGLKAMNNPRLLAASESSSTSTSTAGKGAEQQPKQSSTTVAAAASSTTTTTTTSEDKKSPPPPVAAPASELKGTIVELPPPRSSSSSPKEANSAKAEVAAPTPTPATEESTQQSASASTAGVEIQQHQEQKSQQPEQQQQQQQQQQHNEYAAHLITEVLDLLPTLQYGMDVNPKFTVGVTGYEYTKQLTAFDLLDVELVHGWLIDPEHNKEVYDIVGNRTYNELITNVIQGNEAGIEIDKVQSQIIYLQKQIKEQLQLIEQGKGDSNNENASVTTTMSTTTAPSTPNAQDDNNKNDSSVGAEAATESQVDEKEQQKEWVEVIKVDSEPAEAAIITTATTTASITSTITTTITDSNKSTTTTTSSTNEEAKIAANTNNREGKENDDGKHKLEQLQTELEKLQQRHIELNQERTSGALINDFFNTSCHQLTHFGLTQLYDHLKENDLCVFFRNNHFATITKSSDGLLYLLVTDLGYANVSNVVWETLDVIDGDTDYVDSNFSKSPLQDTIAGSTEGTTLSPEQLLAQSGQNEADYQLALRMSMQDGGNSTNNGTNAATNNNNLQVSLDDEEGRLIAAATEASIREYNGVPSTPAISNTVTTNNAVSAANTPTAAAATGTATPATTPGSTTATNNDNTNVSANSQSAIDEQMIALESIRMSLDNNNNNNNNNINNSAATQGGNNQSSGSSTGYGGVGGLLPGCTTQEESDRLLAMQIESQLQNDEASLRLARQLQAEENALQQQRRQLQQSNNNGNNNRTSTTGRPQQTTTTTAAAGGGGSSGATNNNCIIS